MRKVFAIASKDIRVWARDIAALGILIGMPVVLILILGSALGGTEGGDIRLKLTVVDLDAGVTMPAPGEPPTSSRGVTTDLGDELTDVLTTNARLKKLFDVQVATDAEAAKRDVAAGDVAAALVIPADFTKKVTAAEPAQLVVYQDPGQQTSAGIALSVIRSVAAQYAAASVAVQTVLKVGAEQAASGTFDDPGTVARAQAVAVTRATAAGSLDSVEVKDVQAAPDIELKALDFFGLSMTSMFLMFGAMFGAFSTIKERREQTLSRLLSTPTGAMSVTAGKMLGIFVLGMLQFCVLYSFTRFVFGVRWGADVAAIFLVAAAEMLAVTGLAVLIASLARTERGAGGLGPLVIQIQALIGGAFFTIAVLPTWLQPIRYFSVVGWTMEGWQRVQLEGAGVAGVLGPVAALLGFALAFFAVGAWMTGRRS